MSLLYFLVVPPQRRSDRTGGDDYCGSLFRSVTLWAPANVAACLFPAFHQCSETEAADRRSGVLVRWLARAMRAVGFPVNGQQALARFHE